MHWGWDPINYLRPAAIGLLALAAMVTVALAIAWSKHAPDHDVLSLRAVADLNVSALGQGHSHQGHSHEGDLRPTVGASAADSPACDKDIDIAGSLAGLTFVAAQDNGICSSADIDVYEQGGEFYVVQAGGRDAAFTITHIAADGTPTLITQKTWQQTNTWTPDVKAFKQGNRLYIALSLQRISSTNSTCGSVIVDVTDAPDTAVVDQVTGSDWCDVHNSAVESDANGDGLYLYIAANATNDMRVLDIGDLSNIREIGRYTHPVAGGGVYVHDVTVVDHGGTIGRRVYVSYWNAGLMILDAADVTPGVIEAGSPNQPLNPDYSIRPGGFLMHHAYPSEDGTRAFIQDEFLRNPGDEPVQMWDISSPATPTYVDGISLGSSLMPVINPAHNLLVDGGRLYVGGYKAGLQAFDFDDNGFLGRPLYHQAQTEADDNRYDGAWAVRLAPIGTSTYVIQSDRRYGLIVDALLEPPDSDGDGVPNASDNCPAWPNSDQSLPSWPIVADDPDCDGWGTDDEIFIGTNPNLACATNNWPPDVNDNRVINLDDVLFMAPPVLFSTVSTAYYDARVDFNTDGVINLDDILVMAPPVLYATCTP